MQGREAMNVLVLVVFFFLENVNNWMKNILWRRSLPLLGGQRRWLHRGCSPSNLSESQATQTIYFFSVLRSVGMLAFPPPHLHGLPIIQHRDKLNCTRTPCQRHSGLAYRRPLESDGRCSLPMKGLSVLLLQHWAFPPAHKSSGQTPSQSLIHCRKAPRSALTAHAGRRAVFHQLKP